MEKSTCTLCGSAAGELLYRVSQTDTAPVATLQMMQCKQCGVWYLSPRPSRAEMAQYYSADYVPYVRGKEQRGSILGRFEYHWGLLKKYRVLRRYITQGHLLDVGCGAGDFLAFVRARGWTVTGIDISPAAVAVAKREHSLEILQGNLFSAAYPANHFDAVTLWDVLEHLHSPRETLVEIRRVLKPRGWLFLSLPNVESVDSRLFGAYWAGLMSPRHLYLFPQKTLQQLLREHNFLIHSVECRWGSYFSLLESVRNTVQFSGQLDKRLDFVLKILEIPLSRAALHLYFWNIERLNRGASMVYSCHLTG